jgi:hypothetical protein
LVVGDFHMSTNPAELAGSERHLARGMPSESGKAEGVIAWSSFLFALLQSVCTFFTALDGLRLVIGAGSFAAITQAGIAWDHFHTDWIRVPMVVFAGFGSSLNLVILSRIRRLRERPAAQWRRISLPSRKLRMEGVQFILSIFTLTLLGIEEITHFRTFHHF